MHIYCTINSSQTQFEKRKKCASNVHFKPPIPLFSSSSVFFLRSFLYSFFTLFLPFYLSSWKASLKVPGRTSWTLSWWSWRPWWAGSGPRRGTAATTTLCKHFVESPGLCRTWNLKNEKTLWNNSNTVLVIQRPRAGSGGGGTRSLRFWTWIHKVLDLDP